MARRRQRYEPGKCAYVGAVKGGDDGNPAVGLPVAFRSRRACNPIYYYLSCGVVCARRRWRHVCWLLLLHISPEGCLKQKGDNKWVKSFKPKTLPKQYRVHNNM